MTREGAKKNKKACPQRMDSERKCWEAKETAGEKKGGFIKFRIQKTPGYLKSFN